MARIRRRVRARRGSYELRLPEGERDLLRGLLGELRALLAVGADDPRVRRLYPSAYADDPEQQAEYRRLTQEELDSGRLAAIETVESTLDSTQLSADELTSWMHAVNALRLVLGTMLDVDEGDPFAVDPNDPEAGQFRLYGYLGVLMEEIVQAQMA